MWGLILMVGILWFGILLLVYGFIYCASKTHERYDRASCKYIDKILRERMSDGYKDRLRRVK